MAQIPGSIPITGLLATTDSTDNYAIIDPQYGIDGLRNVATQADRNNISLLRRREGMIVGTLDDGSYWRLTASTGSNTWALGSASNWELWTVAGGSGNASQNKYYIAPSDTVIVATYSQYWIYGNLTIDGVLENYGQVVIANGIMDLSGGGTFSNSGTLLFETLSVGDNMTKYSATFSSSANTPFTISHNLNTLDFVASVREGTNLINVDINIVDNNSIEVTSSQNVTARINIIGL
jgi:hypothetical protein